MKKFLVLSVLAVAALLLNALTADRASALPAFNKQFLETYGESKVADAAKEAKCNVCHVQGEKKSVHNEYGEALSKFITKDDYNELKSDKDALKKKIEEAFEKAGKEKSSLEKSFGDLIEAGELPGGDKDGKR